jgi:uncharacterized protein DUF4386
MSSRPTDPSQRQTALVAGLAYAAIAVLSFFANFFVLERLVDPGDAAATVSNIAGSEGVFRAGVVAWTIVFTLDVVLAWALYRFFEPVSRGLSLLAAWFRVVTAAIWATALIGLLVAAQLADGSGYAAAFDAAQRDALVSMVIDMYHYGEGIALVFFGIYNVFLGSMALRSSYVPSVLGVLLALAGLGYLVDNLALVGLTGYEDYGSMLETISAVLAVVGELSLMVWLLLRGGKAEAREAASVRG